MDTIRIEDLKDGDVILCRTPFKALPMGILSTLIRLFLGIPYNHIKSVGSHNGILMITESDQHGTHPEELYQNLRNSKSTKFLVIRPSEVFFNTKDFSTKIQDTWGKNYGWFLLVKYAFSILTGQPFRSKKARQGKLLVCSHPAAYALGIKEWWHWTPKHWYEMRKIAESYVLNIDK